MTDFDVAVKARFVNEMGSGAKGAAREIDGVTKSAEKLGNTRPRDAFGRFLKSGAADAKKAAKSFDDARQSAVRLGNASFGERLRNQLGSAAEGASRFHSRLQSIGTTLLSLGAGVETVKRLLDKPVSTDANLGDVIIDIAQKANLAKGNIGGLRDEVEAMADRLRSSPLAIGKGVDVLMGAGMDLETSKDLTAPIVKVAKAYRVETEAVSKAVFSMVNNLKIAPDEIEVALGRIAQAASDGRYEVENFAEGMPGLAATMQGLGQTGLSGVSRLAAALETVSGSVGDPALATTSVDDLLQKVISPDVVKNFKDGKVDIAGRIAKAQKEGTDVFEAIYKATMKATGGDTSKVVNFFGDKEARRGVVALMQNWESYKEMRDRYEAINSPDKLNSDFEMRTEGSGNKLRTFAERWEALQASIGKGVNTHLDPVVSKMTEWLDVVTRLSDAVPGLTGSVALLGTALAGVAAMASVGAALKGLAGMLGGGAATATAAPALEGAAAGATAGGLWSLLGKGGKFALKGLGRFLGPAAWAYTGYEVGSTLGAYAATPEGKAAIQKQNADDRQRMELQGRIDQLNGKANSAMSLGDLKALADYNAEIADLYRQLNEVGKVDAKPQVDPSSIDAAIGKVSALTGALQGLSGGPSFMGNAAPASARVPTSSGGGRGPTTNNYRVAGYNPSVVAARIQREQNRQLALSQAGALHDTLSFA